MGSDGIAISATAPASSTARWPAAGSAPSPPSGEDKRELPYALVRTPIDAVPCG